MMNVDVALTSILPQNHQPIALPDNVRDISALLGKGGPIYSNLRMTANRLQKGRELSAGMLEKVAAWLEALHGLELLDPRYKVNSEIDKALQVVMDPQFRFPIPYPNIAEAVLRELEEANWGAEEVVETDEDVESMEEVSNTSIPAVRQAIPARGDPNQTELIYPRDDDPIFGSAGIMHDMIISKGQRRSYRIAEDYHRRDSKVFGHNGIAVGTVWPFQCTAVRDAAHGHMVSGIAGTTREGCYSIIVSGAYDSVDQDFGNTILYSDARALTNKAELPAQTTGTAALRRSIMTRNPVRVLRSSGSKWAGRPKAGYRYDGLYRVLAENVRTNRLGGGFIQFRLERIQDPRWPQPEIVKDAPSAAERDAIGNVKRGITRRR